MIVESKWRSVIKAVTWRFVALFALVTVSFLLTNSLTLAGTIGAVDLVVLVRK